MEGAPKYYQQDPRLNRSCPDRGEIVRTKGEYIGIIFEYVKWFSASEQATRGHDEKQDSTTPGNWKSFVKLQLRTNSRFRALHEKLCETRTVDYLSKTSLNEFVETLAGEISQQIRDEVSKSGMFSLLIDESKDQSKRQELAFVLRYELNGVISERLSIWNGYTSSMLKPQLVRARLSLTTSENAQEQYSFH